MGDEQLIDLVKQHETIYNFKCDAYRDTSIRHAAWEEIAKNHGRSVNECKEDWNKLRNGYNSAMKRRRKKRGNAVKKMHPWRFEGNMAFVKPYLRGEHITSDVDEEIKDYVASPEINSTHKYLTYSDSSSSPDSKTEINLSPTPTSTASKKKKKSSKSSDFTNMINMMKTSQEMMQQKQDLDEMDYFFLSMSKIVKKLPPVDQIRIRMSLHEVVSKAELKQLETQNSL